VEKLTKTNFKVGDRIRGKQWGDLATVTEITEWGFTYKWDKPRSLIPRLNLTEIGGEVYLDECGKYGVSQFELASEELTPIIKSQQEYLCKFIDEKVIT